MRASLADALPEVQVVFFENASVMINWIARHQPDVILISLDHDLPLRGSDGESIDSGTGRQVVDFLATLNPTCPVIVHSSNLQCASGMLFALKDAGWTHSQVFPRDDVLWIREAWLAQIRRYISDGWIN